MLETTDNVLALPILNKGPPQPAPHGRPQGEHLHWLCRWVYHGCDEYPDGSVHYPPRNARVLGFLIALTCDNGSMALDYLHVVVALAPWL